MAKCRAGFVTVSITPKQEKHVKLSFLNEIPKLCKPEFQLKKGSKNVKFGQCLYLVAHLCYEQNQCAERTVTPL